jgi:curved DNA-binding protein CbpA
VDRDPEERARAERRMQDLNAAWTVLSDKDARRAYDASLERRSVSGGTNPIVNGRRETWRPLDASTRSIPEPDLGPVVADEREMEIRGAARLLRPAPLLVMGTALVALVVVASLLGGGEGTTSQRSNLPVVEPTGVPIGCIALAPITEEVPCGQHDAVVWSIVAANTSCPADLDSIYRQSFGGLYCITRVEK